MGILIYKNLLEEGINDEKLINMHGIPLSGEDISYVIKSKFVNRIISKHYRVRISRPTI